MESTTAELLARYSDTPPFNQHELMWRKSRAARFKICWQLGSALDSQKEPERTRLLMDRAFHLWKGESGFIDVYLQRLKSDGDAAQLKLAAKRAGLEELKRDNLWRALRYFNMSQYAIPATGGGDSYSYDREILSAIDNYPLGSFGQTRNKTNRDERLRVAYLVHGASHENSVLIRLLVEFLKYHDQTRFECGYFSCDEPSDYRTPNEAVFRQFNAKLIVSNNPDSSKCLTETEENIRRFAPDLLVGIAVLADYRNYYLFSRFQGVRKTALCYGPPQQYVPFIADFAIGATKHPMLDCPIDGAVVEIETTLPVRPTEANRTPEELRIIPDGAVVLLAAGRSIKFSDQGYWTAIIGILTSRPDVFFVAVGLPHLPEFVAELSHVSLDKERIITVDWVSNYQDYLFRANIVVDTYPSGGGLTMLDAMAFSIPVISFENDYFRPFDQANWNLGSEFLPKEMPLAPRDNLDHFTKLVIRLIDNLDLRVSLGKACHDHVRKTRGKPERMVQRIENYLIENSMCH